jgi:hypothetical protein
LLNSRETGFDSFFCIPGKQGAHEKGGVEGEIGRFRRQHLVAVPAVASLAALNQRIAAADILDDGRVITGRPVTVAAAFAAEQTAMMALPDEMFDPARLLTARVDGRARICVRQNYYSVPARYSGRRITVRLSAMTVQALDGPQVVAVHERAAAKYCEVLTLDHYLEVLKHKPGALGHQPSPAPASAGDESPACPGTARPRPTTTWSSARTSSVHPPEPVHAVRARHTCRTPPDRPGLEHRHHRRTREPGSQGPSGTPPQHPGTTAATPPTARSALP